MSSFSFIGRMLSNVASFYRDINSATLTGAIDVLVVEQPNGDLVASPFHVRFGKLGVIRSREKIVDIQINDEPVEIHMKLGEGGEAFFVENLEQSEDEDELPEHLATSPLPSSANIFEQGMEDMMRENQRRQEEAPKEQPCLRTIKSDGDIKSQESEREEGRLEDAKRTLRDPPGPGERRHKRLIKKKDRQRSLESLDIEIGHYTGIGKPGEGKSKRGAAQKDKNSARFARGKKRQTPKGSGGSLRSDGEEVRRKESMVSAGSFYSTAEGESDSTGHLVQFALDDISDSESYSAEDDALTPRPSMLDIQQKSKEAHFKQDIWTTVDETKTEEDERTPTGKEQLSSSLPERLTGSEMVHSLLRFSTMNNKTNMLAYHPFSDTDYTPNASREHSRPVTPSAACNAVSDTELDRIAQYKDQGEEPEWKWGELPDKTPTEDNPNPNTVAQGRPQAEGGGWGLTSMLGLGHFMRRTRKVRHDPESEGIYLDDLVKSEEMDPQLAALYFPKSGRATNQKAGEKAAATQTEKEEESSETPETRSSSESREETEPERSPRCGSAQDVGYSSHNSSIAGDTPSEWMGEVSISLCGRTAEGKVNRELFMEKLVQYDQLKENPSIIDNDNLIVKVQGNLRDEEKYTSWKEAAPLLLSFVAFQQPLPTSLKVFEEERSDERDRESGGVSVVAGGGVSSWFGWRRAASLDPHSLNKEKSASESKRSETPQPSTSLDETAVFSDKEKLESGEQRRSASVGFPSDPSSESGETKTCRKSLRLKSEQLRALKLRPGMNDARFSVTTKYQGTSYCVCHVFLWKWSDKVVVSDIDGTITKSDVLGQILPVVGGQWAQAGVANLFSRIGDNGYKFLYLSARAIGQSHWTKEYLTSLKQDDRRLPPGPLMLNPTSLINAFHREVILKNPEEFKIKCLLDVKALFPQGIENPFFAGFGNKVNDVYAYGSVGIPIARIFSINHLGEVKYELSKGFTSTYNKMSFDLVDYMFPPFSSDDWMTRIGEESRYWLPSDLDVDLSRFPEDKKQQKKQQKEKSPR